MSNEIAVFDPVNMLMNPQAMAAMDNLAIAMSNGNVMTPAHLRGKHPDCLAIVMQAARWRMDPFVVASKTHEVSGKLGYEAQLVVAVIQNSGAIRGRFHYKYGGAWPNGQDAWVQCGAVLAGETEIQWGEPLYVAKVAVKNSPLWKTNPKQQGSYLSSKYWARLYAPGAILGVYTYDELHDQPQNERDVTPQQAQQTEQVDTLSQVLGGELMEEETDITDILTEFETCKDLTAFAELYQATTSMNNLTDSQKYDLNEAQKAAKARIKNAPPASQGANKEPVDFE